MTTFKYSFSLLILGFLCASIAVTSPVRADDTTVSTIVPPSGEAADSSGPLVRVLLYKTKQPVIVTTSVEYSIYQGEEIVGTTIPGELITFSYSQGSYHFDSDSLNLTATDPFRLVPDDQSATFTLTNANRKVSGRKTNFNVYRGTLDVRVSAKTGDSYVINELPLEEYVAGVDETSDNVPFEYIKALQVAARGYAYTFIAPTTPKHLFDVYGSTADQLYLGYKSEISMPNVVKASNDTTGEMVTYNDKPITTYYFSHTNGKTKTATGQLARPWLKSVPAPYDKGLAFSGHGLGMSLHDALLHAQKAGWDYNQILTYYYASTTVEKLY